VSIGGALTSHFMWRFEKLFLKVYEQAQPNFKFLEQRNKQAVSFLLVVEFILSLLQRWALPNYLH
jgi:hypothetical protein